MLKCICIFSCILCILNVTAAAHISSSSIAHCHSNHFSSCINGSVEQHRLGGFHRHQQQQQYCIRHLLSIRGGKKKNKKSSNDDAADNDDGSNSRRTKKKAMSVRDSEIIAAEAEAEELNEDDFSIDENEGSGGEKNVNPYLISIVDMWEKTPPITQVYIGSSIVLTIGSWLLNKNNWPKALLLDWKEVVTKLQFWRPVTSFLFFGQFGLNYLLTIHFVWTYMAQLEKMNYNCPEDFLVMITFGAFALLIGYTVIGLSPHFLGHNLSTFLVYIWARIFEGTEVNVMDLLLLKAELLPWFFCAQTLVLEGEVPFADLLGIAVGHLYYYLHKKKFLEAPSFMKKLFLSPKMKQTYAKFKEDFE